MSESNNEQDNPFSHKEVETFKKNPFDFLRNLPSDLPAEVVIAFVSFLIAFVISSFYRCVDTTQGIVNLYDIYISKSINWELTLFVQITTSLVLAMNSVWCYRMLPQKKTKQADQTDVADQKKTFFYSKLLLNFVYIIGSTVVIFICGLLCLSSAIVNWATLFTEPQLVEKYLAYLIELSIACSFMTTLCYSIACFRYKLLDKILHIQ